MPQAAVRIAPSLPAAHPARPGGEARAAAGAGAAGDAPGLRGPVPAIPVGPGPGGRPFPESRSPKIDGARRGAAMAPRGSA